MSGIKIVTEGGIGEIVEKKSRFIATICPVNSEQEATEFIDSMKKKYWDARHNCSAFVIGNNNEITRCSDDGEPSGTAGRPMLEVLTGGNLHNVAVVVTRYFGGVLLGTGGLVRAYQAAVKEAMNNITIASKRTGMRYQITMPYNDFSPIQSFMTNGGHVVEDIDYSDKVVIKCIFGIECHDKAAAEIVNITSGRADVKKIKECEYLG